MSRAPRSERFDDVYFSAAGGLAEAQYVFLAGNDLPARWQRRAAFTVCETGFGTGLNFLALWDLFERTAVSGQRLHYISFEKYPLAATEILAMLTPLLDPPPLQEGGKVSCIPSPLSPSIPSPLLRGEVGRGVTEHMNEKLATMLAQYPVNPHGTLEMRLNETLSLTLIFDDVNAAIPNLQTQADAWFLDGFAPAKNPDMWTDTLFENMARLSAPGTTFASFTAAGSVRRGLSAAGFHVEKRPGFGHKRHMIAGWKT